MLTRLDLRSHLARHGTRGLIGHLPRPHVGGAEPIAAVRAILDAVRAEGDVALERYSERFDGIVPDRLRVDPDECVAALGRVPSELRAAFEVAHEAITAYHQTQLHPAVDQMHNGLRLRSFTVPVDRAGCYVPGGKAPLASSVLMTAAIAKVAGVGQVVLCSPPDRATGRPADAILAAAAIAGVDELYAVGGAHAIGALAYGTATIASVDVIVGPGNVYVSVAKREVASEGRVGVPSSFAGPSEVVVVADASVPARFAAIDIVLQAEHGTDGLAWLVTWDPAVADAVTAEVAAITAASPRRALLEANFAEGGHVVLVNNAQEAMAISNAIAPEHLELMTADPEALLPLVRHAGAVFTGPWAPASIGDYVAGPSHVLPTFGSARFGSALTVSDFTKHVHVVTTDEAGLRRAAPHVAAMATAEGLAAHADSVLLRVAALDAAVAS
jgi:histidinol dehydrogenase